MPAATSQQILLTDYAWPNLAIEERLVAAAGHQLIVARDGREETLIGLAQKRLSDRHVLGHGVRGGNRRRAPLAGSSADWG